MKTLVCDALYESCEKKVYSGIIFFYLLEGKTPIFAALNEVSSEVGGGGAG